MESITEKNVVKMWLRPGAEDQTDKINISMWIRVHITWYNNANINQ
jgi:hypothetical protein